MTGALALSSRVVVLTFLLLPPRSALAADCPPDAAAARERTRAIHADLDDQAQPARLWAWAWGVGYAALTVGQGVPAALVDDGGTRTDLAVGAVSSGIAMAAVIAMPPEVIAGAESLGRRLESEDDACEQLRLAETLLESAAADQAFGSGPAMHAINVGFNVATGLVLGLGWGRWRSGALTALSGAVIGELQIFTMPTGLLDSPPPEPSLAAIVPWSESGLKGLSLAFVF